MPHLNRPSVVWSASPGGFSKSATSVVVSNARSVALSPTCQRPRLSTVLQPYQTPRRGFSGNCREAPVDKSIGQSSIYLRALCHLELNFLADKRQIFPSSCFEKHACRNIFSEKHRAYRGQRLLQSCAKT